MLSKSRDVFYILIVAISLIFSIDCSHKSFDSKENRLLTLLGEFPSPPPLEIDTLETTYLENGVRYKIEYTAEEEDTLFDRPSDRIRAYLFVPKNEKNIKLPAIIAVHQDGSKTHLGKKEPAGIEGDKNLYYGLDLFQRGYVVICPDRMRHAERRRISNAESAGTDMTRDNTLVAHWCGQLILSGMTYYGKEVYDLMRAMDVLYSLDYVDKDRIGAIGHSGGGNILVYYMFVDKRLKVGVSSCGFFELLDHYNENAPKVPTLGFAIPGLAKIGKSADYLSYIAPRPFMMTRGLYEHGQNAEVQKYNEKHVNETKAIEKYARERYQRLNATDKLQAIYFQGGHDFPPAIREKAYRFIDKYLKY